MNITLKDKVKDYINEHNMFENCDVVVVGLSGGADSVCMTQLLYEILPEYNIMLEAYHVHHGIRGEEAWRDYNFAKSFCEERGIRFNGVEIDVPLLAKNEGLTVEEAGRLARYKTFNCAIDEWEKKGKRGKIAVAHNMNDNAETVLFNMFRGTGLSGMAGIKPVNGRIIRPLLGTKRQQIELFLDEANISYCIDSTNLKQDYTRNITRHKILPVATQINNKAIEHISEAAIRIRETKGFIEEYVDNFYGRVVICKTEDKISLDANALRQEHSVIIGYLFRKVIGEMSYKLKDVYETHIIACKDILFGSTGRSADLPYGLKISLSYDCVTITRNNTCDKAYNDFYMEFICDDNLMKQLKNGIEIKVPNGKFDFLIIDKITINIRENDYTKFFDYAKIKCGFSLRTRKDGDYITINKNGNCKKLKKFFIDNKIPAEERNKIIMLASGEDILFIPGLRGSEGYHVDETTKLILKVTFTPDNL